MTKQQELVQQETVKEVSNLSPMAQAIMSGNLSPDVVDKMLDAQAKYDAMEARKAYNEAMTQFRADVRPAMKTGKNTHLRTTYATFDDMLAAASGPLGSSGFNLEFKQEQNIEKNTVTVITRVTHAAGHSESTSLTAVIEGNKGINSLQALGLTISYLKRYGMAALLGLATEDSDGQITTPPVVEMLDESDMIDIMAVCEECGKDYDKWHSFMSQKYPVIENVIQIPKVNKGALIAQIRKSAAKVVAK